MTNTSTVSTVDAAAQASIGAPLSPCAADSYSVRIRALYSAVNVRLLGRGAGSCTNLSVMIGSPSNALRKPTPSTGVSHTILTGRAPPASRHKTYRARPVTASGPVTQCVTGPDGRSGVGGQR